MSDRITDIIIGDHVELMAENRRLQEEVERLRAALQTIAYLQHDIGRPPLISEAEAMRLKARDALYDSHQREKRDRWTDAAQVPLVDPAEYDDAGAAERYNRGLK